MLYIGVQQARAVPSGGCLRVYLQRKEAVEQIDYFLCEGIYIAILVDLYIYTMLWLP